MSTESGPLSTSFDLSGTKTTIPTIANDQWCKLRLTNVSEKPDDKQRGPVITWEWELAEPAPGSDGQTIQPGAMGSKLFDNIYCWAKPDSKDKDWFKKKMAARIDAILNTGDPDNKKGKAVRPGNFDAGLVSQMLGQCVLAKIKVKGGEFTGNEIDKIVHLSDGPSA